MLQMTADKKINAQDVVISANILNQDGYVVFPAESMSNHIGFKDGQHCSVLIDDYTVALAQRPVNVKAENIFEDHQIVRSLHHWFVKVHLKLLLKYIFTLGPVRNYLNKKRKRKDC